RAGALSERPLRPGRHPWGLFPGSRLLTASLGAYIPSQIRPEVAPAPSGLLFACVASPLAGPRLLWWASLASWGGRLRHQRPSCPRAGPSALGPGPGENRRISPRKISAYNIHVNGVLHCRVRYSQLLGLHEQLRKEYGANVLPAFPPKKLFSLTPAEVEQRREQLEKYMQAVL
uniref:PX domain-containing protein n=1 Tax=Felis catus TaxID=9685 RepID=A0ABI7X6C4_FELCA